MKEDRVLTLGAGVTGLAVGYSSRRVIFEASEYPGGICSSYYMTPGGTQRCELPPVDGEAYRFELGGGHWIFGGEPSVLHFINRLSAVKAYKRSSAVYFRDDNRYVEYPIQNNLRAMPREFACAAVAEMSEMSGRAGQFRTMKEWLAENFGPTLCDRFFFPFHDLYTAGLSNVIAPQDAYKSPINLPQIIKGSFDEVDGLGYNVTFVYPRDGLNGFARKAAAQCDIRYGKKAIRIDTKEKAIFFADDSVEKYDTLICTAALNRTLEMTDLITEAEPCPYTSVLVLNIGATKGPACPPYHWLYNLKTKSGFHRVGFYSNVDVSFLPKSAREKASAVSIYVERAYRGGEKPSEQEIASYSTEVVNELREWGFIEKLEVIDPTWIDVAYTWEFPESKWKKEALRLLEARGIFMVGRYGRWIFQGIADSIRDGFIVGSAFR